MSEEIPESSLSGAGSLDIYKNFDWAVNKGTASMDKELRNNWNSCNWEILDLVLIMDCTASMSAWIDHCKATLNTVIDNIVRENEKLKVRVAFVGFRDFKDDKIFAIQDFTFDILMVKSFISQQAATGGHDTPEDVVGALHQVLKLSWFPGSVRLAALIADAPTHGKEYHDLYDDDFPEGSPAGLNLVEVVRQFREKQVDLTLYKLNNTTEKMYGIMENVGDRSTEDTWVSFVDLRKEVRESRGRGLGLSSRYMTEAYTIRSSEHMSERYRYNSDRSTNPSR